MRGLYPKTSNHRAKQREWTNAQKDTNSRNSLEMARGKPRVTPGVAFAFGLLTVNLVG